MILTGLLSRGHALRIMKPFYATGMFRDVYWQQPQRQLAIYNSSPKKGSSENINRSSSRGKVPSSDAISSRNVDKSQTKSSTATSGQAQQLKKDNASVGPQVLPNYPDSLLPKVLSPWSGLALDFNKLVVHEDDSILVVFKPSGVMSQPDDEDKIPAFDSVVAGISQSETQEQNNVIVKNNRYFFPDVDIVTLASEYLRETAKSGKEDKKSTPKSHKSNTEGIPKKPFTVGLIHRLDRPASGLMVLAKTPEALRNLNQQFADQEVIKRYLCMVNGRLDAPETCVDYLLKSSGDISKVIRNPFRKPSATNSTRISSNNKPKEQQQASIDDFLSVSPIATSALAKNTDENALLLRNDVVRAELSYKPLHVTEHSVRKKWANAAGGQESKKASMLKKRAAPKEREPETIVKVMEDGFVETKSFQSLLDVTLHTGRKHQIRAQLSHRQHAIVGDQKYLAPQAFGERDIALHAYYLCFFHPTSRRKMAFRIDVPRIWERRFGESVMEKIAAVVARPAQNKPAVPADELENSAAL